MLINENSGLNVIKSVSHNSLRLEELLIVCSNSLIANFVQSRLDLTLEVRVHLNSGSSCCLRLRLPQMLLSEKELPVEIAHLYDIRIC